MPRFFDNVQLKVLKGQIYIKEQEVSSLKGRYERANLNQDTTRSQLKEARDKLYDLEEQCKNKQIECEKKLQELQKAMSDGSQLASDLSRMLNEVEVAKQDLEEKRNRDTSLHQEMLSMNSRMQYLQRRIKEYDAEINQPGPQPQLRTGNYCVNGHLHCPNLPNDQIQTVLIPPSQEEVSQYRQKVERARALKAKLVDELAGLQNQYRHLEKEYSLSNAEYQAAVSHLNKCQQQVENQQKQIIENEALFKQTEQEHNDLLEEANKLNESIEKTRLAINNLCSELTNAEYETENAKNQWIEAELELQCLNKQYEEMVYQAQRNNRIDDSVLEAMVRQKLAEEERARQETDLEEEPTPSMTLSNLTESAKQTVSDVKNTYNNAKETVKQFVSDVVTTVGDIWPSPVGLMTKAMFENPDMQQLQQDLGVPPQEHTGDLLIDYAKNQHRLKP